MNNHIYSFGGNIKLQKGFGCIGDRAIGVLAMLIMIWWSDKFTLKLKEMKIVYELIKIYVDDLNGIFHTIAPGLEYKEGKLTFNPEKAEDDMDEPDDIRTMKVIQQIANSIEDMIEMTIDVPTNHDDGKVPMLDVKAWINNDNNVFYEFYEKPTKNRLVISKTSAMPVKKKIQILSQEVFRRLHNTKHESKWNQKVDILDKFMCELKASGYSQYDRLQILKSGVSRYNILREKEEKGMRTFFVIF